MTFFFPFAPARLALRLAVHVPGALFLSGVSMAFRPTSAWDGEAVGIR